MKLDLTVACILGKMVLGDVTVIDDVYNFYGTLCDKVQMEQAEVKGRWCERGACLTSGSLSQKLGVTDSCAVLHYHSVIDSDEVMFGCGDDGDYPFITVTGRKVGIEGLKKSFLLEHECEPLYYTRDNRELHGCKCPSKGMDEVMDSW
jgi:hypothetical protein